MCKRYTSLVTVCAEWKGSRLLQAIFHTISAVSIQDFWHQPCISVAIEVDPQLRAHRHLQPRKEAVMKSYAANTSFQSGQTGRIHWLPGPGAPILVLDVSQASSLEILNLLDDFSVLLSQPYAHPLRVLMDFTNAAYEPSISSKWKAAWLQHAFKIHALSAFGASGLSVQALQSFVDLLDFLGYPQPEKKLRLFKAREEALLWLTDSPPKSLGHGLQWREPEGSATQRLPLIQVSSRLSPGPTARR
jgi:hypothetical protein